MINCGSKTSKQNSVDITDRREKKTYAASFATFGAATLAVDVGTVAVDVTTLAVAVVEGVASSITST